MELISPRTLTGVKELKQELFLRAEELERLVAIYKLKLCGEEMASLNHGSMLVEERNTEILGDRRGKCYDIYMRKREEKSREEWLARGPEKAAMMESLASASSAMKNGEKATGSKNDHSRQTDSRKPSSSSSIPSSTSRSSAMATHNPTIRPSNPRISNERTLQRSMARSQSSNDRKGLAKDIKARRSQSLRKNSGEPKDFMQQLNYDQHASLTPPVNTNLSKHGAPKPLRGKSDGIGPTTGLSKAKTRISMASQAPISEESQLQESTEMLEEGNDQVDSMRIEDVRKLRLSKESGSSAYHRFESNGQIAEIPKSNRIQNSPSNAREACFDPATGDLHMNQNLEGKTVRVRKKWGSIERPFAAVDASNHPIMEVTKGIKRFFKIGRRSGGIEMHNNDKKYEHDSENNFNRPHNPSHSASLKEKEKHLLANSPKMRVLSSLPSFHVRENENKGR